MLMIGFIIGLVVGLIFSVMPIRIYKAMAESYNDLYRKYINLRAEMTKYYKAENNETI